MMVQKISTTFILSLQVQNYKPDMLLIVYSMLKMFIMLVGTDVVAFNSTATACCKDHCSCMIGHIVWAIITLLALVLSTIVIAILIVSHRCKSRRRR